MKRKIQREKQQLCVPVVTALRLPTRPPPPSNVVTFMRSMKGTLPGVNSAERGAKKPFNIK